MINYAGDAPPFVQWFDSWRFRNNRWGVRCIIQPRLEPISLAQAAEHLRIDTYDSPPEYPEATLIQAQISAAREFCEQYLGRALAPQTLEWSGHSFPPYDFFELPFGPVLVVESITYYDTTTETDIGLGTSEYIVDTGAEPTRVYTHNFAPWPSIPARPGGVKVRYQAGFSIASDSPNELPLPFSIRAAILLMLGHLYEHREPIITGVTAAELPLSVKALLDPHRLRLSMA